VGATADLKTALLLAVISLAGTAQMPPSADVIPPGWAKTGGNPPDYTVVLDRDIFRAGHASGQLRNRIKTTSTGTLTQRVRADAYLRKRIRVSAWVRTRDAQSVLFFVRVDGPGMTVDFDNTDNQPVPATSDWVQRSLVVDVDATAIGITFGIVMEGTGVAWLDDVAVEIVPLATPRTDAPPAKEKPSPELEKTLRQRYAVEPVKPRNLDFEEPLKFGRG
jgi:hypothetical protein